MSRDAKECDYCNKLFCKLCIENWLILNKDCPMCHKDIKIRGASRVVKEIISSFRIQCSFCPQVIRLSEIEKHEAQCGKVTCDNPICNKHLRNQKYYQVVTSEGKLSVCNDVCETMAKFERLRTKKGYTDCLKFYQATLSSGGQQGTISGDKRVQIKPQNPDIDNARRTEVDSQNSRQRNRSIGHHRNSSTGLINPAQGFSHTQQLRQTLQPIITNQNNINTLNNSSINHGGGIIEDGDNYEQTDPNEEPEGDEDQEIVQSRQECVSPGYIIRRQRNAIVSFQWDPNYASDVVQISSQNRCVFLKEEAYLFRSIIANKSFNEGIHYWEIIADARSENEIKIGVTKNRDFDLKTAFCDYSFGWAYYAVGQLRHCDGANGQTFGSKQFKKEGVLGILLDMNKGQISVAVNNHYLGVAFEDEELKKGPIWPAVALLHVAGCTLVTGCTPPYYFFA